MLIIFLTGLQLENHSLFELTDLMRKACYYLPLLFCGHGAAVWKRLFLNMFTPVFSDEWIALKKLITRGFVHRVQRACKVHTLRTEK